MYTTLVVVLCNGIVFGDGLFLDGVYTFEGYVYIGLFKEVGDFSDLGAVTGKNGTFFVVVIGHVGFVLYMCFQFSYEM